MFFPGKITILANGDISITESHQTHILDYDDFLKVYKYFPCIDTNATLRSILLMMDKYKLNKMNPFVSYYIEKAKNLPPTKSLKFNHAEVSSTITFFNNNVQNNTEIIGVISNDKERYSLLMQKTVDIIDLPLKIGLNRMFFSRFIDGQKIIFEDTIEDEHTIFNIVEALILSIMVSGTEEDKERGNEKIKEAIKQAEDGKFASESDIANLLKKMRDRNS